MAALTACLPEELRQSTGVRSIDASYGKWARCVLMNKLLLRFMSHLRLSELTREVFSALK